MKSFSLLFLLISVFACKQSVSYPKQDKNSTDRAVNDQFTIVFASCNDQDRDQPLWKPILENTPDLFIWGGDNIYADTDNMVKMKADYDKLLSNKLYNKLASTVTVLGTWDDHDYGKNDAGSEWEMKKESQQLFLDFLKIPEEDLLRSQEGVYYSRRFETPSGSVKIILLDTRYFRDPLKKSDRKGWRYDPWDNEEKMTILGEKQWNWFERELEDDSATFTIIVSSIQFLNDEHGYEKWGNFPSEIAKMNSVLQKAKARNIMILSGDRHMAEFSLTKLEGLSYDLVDFTTSGLTHTFPDSPPSPNRFREGKEIKDLNFGVLRIDFKNTAIQMEIRGKDNVLLEEFKVQY